ncbi:MAG: GNAT family acetyltransferase [Kordiimonadaceae bacterium]|nr:GNAT family acetyltransferase [Kordiimonadaceae bacterium]
MQIREIRDGDECAVVELWRAALLIRPWNDAEADIALARRSQDSSVILLGFIEGILAASIMVGFEGHRGWVYYLAVAEQFRRKGLGKAMMAAAEKWLKEKGAPKVQLMVREDNAAANGFYDALGFEVQPVTVLGKRF